MSMGSVSLVRKFRICFLFYLSDGLADSYWERFLFWHLIFAYGNIRVDIMQKTQNAAICALE